MASESNPLHHMKISSKADILKNSRIFNFYEPITLKIPIDREVESTPRIRKPFQFITFPPAASTLSLSSGLSGCGGKMKYDPVMYVLRPYEEHVRSSYTDGSQLFVKRLSSVFGYGEN